MRTLDYLKEFDLVMPKDETDAIEQLIESHRRLREWNVELQEERSKLPSWKRWLAQKLGFTAYA